MERLSKRPRKRAIGAGRRFALDLRNRVLLLLFYYRTYATQDVAAEVFGADQATVSRSIEQVAPLVRQRSDLQLFFMPALPSFQCRSAQVARSANRSALWLTSPHTMSLILSYFFSGFRYLSPMIRHILIRRMACST